MDKHLLADIKRALPALELREEEPMAAHCSFRIGGKAAAMALPASAEELTALAVLLREKGVEPFVMGNGTNLLVTDGPLDRFVIKCGAALSAIHIKEECVTAEAGATLAQTAAAALAAELTGLEFAAGIPGTVGGGVSMNAGAYGGELKDVTVWTDYLDGQLRLCRAEGEAQGFAYRRSAFSGPGCIVLRSGMRLTRGEHGAVAARMRELGAKRRASPPLDMPSAGSTFKRPVGGYAAALIDEAGLKGFRIGGAQVSEKHAGFVVNAGGARFDDVLALMEHIQQTVWTRSGIRLEPEVRIVR